MKNSRRPAGIGISSLFAVMIVLCLVVFAVLAKITAESELKLAQKAADSVTAFYEAEFKAIERLANVNGGESGEFTEDIDENRELSVKFSVINGEIFIQEWAVVRKDTGEKEEKPLIGEPPRF